MAEDILSGLVAKARESVRTSTDLILAVIGAGAGAAVAEVAKSWFPEQTKDLTDEVLAAGIGFALFYWGGRIHRLLVPFGFGVFLASVGAWSAEYTAGIILMLKKKE